MDGGGPPKESGRENFSRVLDLDRGKSDAKTIGSGFRFQFHSFRTRQRERLSRHVNAFASGRFAAEITWRKN